MPSPSNGANQQGFTLIELLVSILIASIIVGAVLSIYTRMSVAYRGENQKSSLEQVLRAARTAIERDIRQAGFGLPTGIPDTSNQPTGFLTAALGTPAAPIKPLTIVNAANGATPDSIRVFYADASSVTRVTSMDPGNAFATVDDQDTFQVNDIIVLANPRVPIPSGGTGGDLIEFDACVVKITAIDTSPAVFHFNVAGAPYNEVGNSQCSTLSSVTNTEGAASETMAYRFVGRSYRIDPTRKDVSVLQMSPSGELVANDWQDLAIGFTDMQIATRYFEEGDTTDLDGDGDATRDWYSGEAQEDPDPTTVRPANAVLVRLNLSLAVRTTDEVDAVPSASTPGFTDTSSPPDSINHNRFGDSPPITLAGVADSSRPVEHRGDHIYRFSSQYMDLRNLGIGR